MEVASPRATSPGAAGNAGKPIDKRCLLNGRVCAVIVITWFGCGENRALPDAAEQPIDAIAFDAPPDADPLSTLAGTGLCLDSGCTQINPDAKQYEPRFQLWADTASKRRWIQLPPGTQIDNSDMNRWVFPVGTKLWKEFVRDGTRVETRFITKQLADDDAPGAWFFVTYEWNSTQDATAARIQAVTNANGTMHDIPSRSQCRDCHDSLRPSRVLGFQALQLDYNAGAGLLDLEDLIAANLLSNPPAGGVAGARFQIPGNVVERTALTYLHANCGHCHNPSSPTHDVAPMDVRLDTSKLATVAITPAFVTLVDVEAAMPFFDSGINYEKLVVRGSATTSNLMFRTNATNFRHMPKVGSELVDPDGQTALVTWINAL